MSGGRAPLKQWKWLTVVWPPAAPSHRHTSPSAHLTLLTLLQTLSHQDTSSRNIITASSNITTYHNVVIYPHYSVQTCACGTGHSVTPTFHLILLLRYPLFAREPGPAPGCQAATAGPPLTRTIYFQFQQNLENFAKWLGSEAKRKVIGDRAPHILLAAAQSTFSIEKIRTGETGKVKSETG